LSRLRVQSVRLRELVELADLEADGRNGLIAISRTRARAWQHNPHAEPDDVVLLTAREDDLCVGYLGLLPGRMRIHGRDERVLWLSTLYVPPAHREDGIGALLLMRACALGATLCATGSPRETRALGAALGFVEPGSARYYELHLTRGLAAVQRAVAYPALGLAFRAAGEVHGKPIDGLRDRRLEHAAERRAPVRFLRDAALVHWMLRVPWVATSALDDTRGYQFADYRDRFEHRLLEIHGHRGAAGVVALRLVDRNGLRSVDVLDAHLEDDAHPAQLLSLAVTTARGMRADRLRVPERCGHAIERSRIASALFTRRERRTFVRPAPGAHALREALSDLTLDFCDGDAAFV
jgi:GNAT superfamily N-acetyltransferase